MWAVVDLYDRVNVIPWDRITSFLPNIWKKEMWYGVTPANGQIPESYIMIDNTNPSDY